LTSVLGACASGSSSSPANVGELQQRVNSLSAELQAVKQQLSTVQQQQAAQAAAATRPAPSPPASAAAAPAAAPTNPAPPAQATAPAPSSASNPAALEEDESVRALERTLVVQGNLLLPPGAMEIQPSFQYAYSNTATTLLVSSTTAATQSTREDQAIATLAFRAGLPWASQLDVSVPYSYVRTRSSGGSIQSTQSTGGLTDLQVGLSHQFLNDVGWQPGLIGTVSWKPATSTPNIVNFFNGTNLRPFSRSVGFNEVSAGFNVVKRKDPIVFTASYSHVFAFSDTRNGTKLNPGDSNNFSAGAVLAASPDVSLLANVTASYFNKIESGGTAVAGTDDVIASFNTGASIVLTPRVLLQLTVGAGLTPGAPNFIVGVALPIRF
jgi:hypothetical protein